MVNSCVYGDVYFAEQYQHRCCLIDDIRSLHTIQNRGAVKERYVYACSVYCGESVVLPLVSEDSTESKKSKPLLEQLLLQ